MAGNGPSAHHDAARVTSSSASDQSWEVPIAELGRSVFVIPAEAFKSRRAHVVILNAAAWSIIETQRGKHPVWVFSYRGERVERMNNTAW